MRIGMQDFETQNNHNYPGRGEQRWAMSWVRFLTEEGYDVQIRNCGDDRGIDLFLYAPWETCCYSQAAKHIHFSFFGVSDGYKQFPCFESGTCNIAVPYKITYDSCLQKAIELNVGLFLMPTPYPDSWIPADLTPGFHRTGIVWANREIFCPEYEDFKRGALHIPENGVCSLKALVRLAQETTFQLTIVGEDIDRAAAHRGVPDILAGLPHVQKYPTLRWSRLIGVMGQQKLNLTAGGQLGSTAEALLCGVAPVLYADNFVNHKKFLLPRVKAATEDDIYQALKTLWFDSDIYQQALDFYEIDFQHHRTAYLRQYWQQVLETAR